MQRQRRSRCRCMPRALGDVNKTQKCRSYTPSKRTAFVVMQKVQTGGQGTNCDFF